MFNNYTYIILEEVKQLTKFIYFHLIIPLCNYNITTSVIIQITIKLATTLLWKIFLK